MSNNFRCYNEYMLSANVFHELKRAKTKKNKTLKNYAIDCNEAKYGFCLKCINPINFDENHYHIQGTEYKYKDIEMTDENLDLIKTFHICKNCSHNIDIDFPTILKTKDKIYNVECSFTN